MYAILLVSLRLHYIYAVYRYLDFYVFFHVTLFSSRNLTMCVFYKIHLQFYCSKICSVLCFIVFVLGYVLFYFQIFEKMKH